MIPKIIHYCWFGKKTLPPLAVRCIRSWKKYLPDYEIKEWNEDNFDVNIIPYSSEAYQAKKYAFVSDYARFYILYHHGGLYFDTDVEVIRPMDDIIKRGAFMGCENEIEEYGGNALAVAPGLGLGCEPGNTLYMEILKLYEGMHFLRPDGSYNMTTVVTYVTSLLESKGLKNINEIQCVTDVLIYPKDFFCPINYQTSVSHITPNTRSIHHYASSWHSKWQQMFKYIAAIIGKDNAHRLGIVMKKMHILK